MNVRKSETDIAWLERKLRRDLQRVPAPGGLWDLVMLPRPDAPQPPTRRRTLPWLLAAASVAVASVVAVAWGYYPHAQVDFRSHQTSVVRDWIRSRTGIDVPLAAQPDSGIEMIQVNLGHSGIVEVRYRAAGRDASLTVGRATAARSHREVANIHGATTASWTAGQHSFTLSVQHPGDMRAACLVCHV